MENQAQPTQSVPPIAAVEPAPVAQPAPVMPQQPPVMPPAAPAAPSVPPSTLPKKSSKMGLILVIITLIVLGVGGWFAYTYFMNKSNDASLYQNTPAPTVVPTATPTPTPGPVKSGDADLDQQSDTIDAEIDKASTDVTNVDSGLKDQPENLNQ